MTRRYNYGKFGKRKTHHYNPKNELIQRLATELKQTPAQIRKRIAEERLFLLREVYGDEISLKDI